MNERIQELVCCAKFMAEETINSKISKNAELDAFAEKFADLIVRECMKVASPNYMNTPEDSVYYVEEAIGRIAKHFGVKE